MNLLYPRVDYSHQNILRIFFVSQVIFLLPFIITDLALISNNKSDCLYANLFTKNYFGVFTLGQWVQMDGYIKLAIIVSVLFLNVIQFQVKCKAVLVVLCGNIIRFFYIFDLGWTIVCSVLFWGHKMQYIDPLINGRTYTYCEGSPYKGYIFFLLIFSYLIIPINIYIGGFRSKDVNPGDDLLTTTRRATELMEKSTTNQT